MMHTNRRWATYEWRRPSEIYGPRGYSLYQDEIDPNDIKQGNCGDCYFLSSLASLAEEPKRIAKIFK
jgi:calpain-15